MIRKLNHVMALATTSATALALSAAAALAAPAQDFSGMATTIKSQINAGAVVASYAAFAIGLFFGIAGFLKLKAYTNAPQDPSNKPTIGIMMILIGAGLIAIPTVMGVGVGSLFGQGGTNVNVTGDGFQGF